MLIKLKLLEDNKCIKRFILFVSAEGVGAQQEYNRFGMDWDMFTRNVEYYLDNTKGVCSFMSAFNILSIPTFYNFLQYVADLKNKYYIKEFQRTLVDIPYVKSPGFLDAKISTYDLVQEYLYPCVSLMRKNKFPNIEIQKCKGLLLI